MRISELDIPDQVKQVLSKRGYDALYPPQIEAIAAGVLNGKNVVLASPTASGKTLVAELCILQNILRSRGKGLYLTPLRALASEKYEEFQKYDGLLKADGTRLRIAASTGDYDNSDEWLGRYDIIISTNEKVDSLLRHRAPWMNEIKTVVADEIHLLNDQDRGPTLEITLTKLRELNPKSQILALSATVKNADDIAGWIKGTPITTDWRPVPLREGVYYDGEIQFKDGSARRIPEETDKPVLDIALQVIHGGGQILVFTETRRTAVEYGRKASLVLSKSIPPSQKRSLKIVADKILNFGERTRLSETLAEQVQSGVAFHHAGLASAHRKVIEDAFKAGSIKILAATPTLAAGVNLPARAVLITSYERYEPGYGRYPISVLEYKQFSGRAGRPRYDNFGESMLIAKTADEQEYLMENYLRADPEKIWSKLSVERVLRPHVLSTIATRFAHTEESLYHFFSRTFHAHQYDLKMLQKKVGRILEFLVKEEMIEIDGGKLSASRFGKRVSELYIDPLSAVIIRDGLYDRPKKLSEISLLQLVVHTPDMAPRLYPRGKESERLTAYSQEHSDELIFKSPEPWSSIVPYEQDYDDFLSELKCVAVIADWIEEFSEEYILDNYKVEPGDLLRLTQTAEWLIYATNELAKLFQHKDLQNTLNNLRTRVQNGIKQELVELVSLEGVGRVRARMLFNSGFRNIGDLKRASLSSLTSVPTIGMSVAKRIKDQVGGKLKVEEWEALKKGYSLDEQRLLTEYDDK